MDEHNALKAISMTDDELVVGNYIVLFGGRDLTGLVKKNKDGSSGEFFTQKTMLESNYTKTGRLYVDFEHGQDEDRMGIGRDDILGYVDWSTAKTDARGVFVTRVLNRRNQYLKWLEPLIEEGLVGNSSESIQGQVQKTANGEIEKWPLRRDTLTVTPMEPRMISQNALTAIKALAVDFPNLKSLIPSEQAALPSDEESNPEIQTIQGENKMADEIDVKAVVAAALKERDEAEAVKAAHVKEIEDAKAEGAKEAVEELKSKKLLRADQYHTVDKTSDSDEGVGAFKAWLGTGQVNRELIEPASWATKTSGVTNLTTGAEGGYAVPDPLLNRIIAKRDLSSWVRQAPCQFFQTEADHILIPVEDTRYADFTSTAESAAYTNDTTGNMAQINLALTKYTSYLKVSEEFLSAKNSNWEAWIADVLGRVEAGTENSLATTVIAADATAGTAFASATAITEPELARCVGELSNGYAVNGEAGFLVKNGTKWYLKGIAGNSFAFLPTPSGNDFFGFPAFVSDDMAAMTAGLASVIFGNFKYFAVVETPGMVVQRNPYLYMASGQVGIFAHIRRGYDVLQAEAIRKYSQA